MSTAPGEDVGDSRWPAQRTNALSRATLPAGGPCEHRDGVLIVTQGGLADRRPHLCPPCASQFRRAVETSGLVGSRRRRLVAPAWPSVSTVVVVQAHRRAEGTKRSEKEGQRPGAISSRLKDGGALSRSRSQRRVPSLRRSRPPTPVLEPSDGTYR